MPSGRWEANIRPNWIAEELNRSVHVITFVIGSFCSSNITERARLVALGLKVKPNG
jgi:hypothetical protein